MALIGVPEVELWLRRDGEDVLASADGGAERRVRLGLEEALWMPHELTPRRFARGAGRVHDTARSLAALGARLADVVGPLLAPHAATRPLRVRLCGDDFDLLALPWEAAILGDAGPLGLLPDVEVVREVGGDVDPICPALPGPLRLLVAVASPHGDPDTADELAHLLAAAADLPHVEFLDGAGATVDALRARLDRGPVHAVHLAALSRPGALLLEDADGRVAEVAPTDLAAALAGARHPPALVVLSTRSTGAALEGPGPMHTVEPLLHAGLARVIAVQGTVDVAHAADLARHLYAGLVDPHTASPAAALARARLAVAHPATTHASAALFVARGLADHPLARGDRPAHDLPAPPILVSGLPHLPGDRVLGRRGLRRDLHAALARPGHRGAQLIGAPGLGATDLATSVLADLQGAGWTVATVHGAFALADLARVALDQLDPRRLSPAGRGHLHQLGQPGLAEKAALAGLAALLAADPVVLVLADFAANLHPDGALPTGLARALRDLAGPIDRGALLVLTDRRIAGPGDLLTPLVVDPLPATTAELLLRASPRLRARTPAERAALHTACAGLPRRWHLAAAAPHVHLQPTTAIDPPRQADPVPAAAPPLDRHRFLAPPSTPPSTIDPHLTANDLAAPSITSTSAPHLTPSSTPTTLDPHRATSSTPTTLDPHRATSSTPTTLDPHLATPSTRTTIDQHLLDAALADLDPDTRRFHAGLLAVRRPADDVLLAVVAAAQDLAWDDDRRAAAIADLVARGLLRPIHAPAMRWLPRVRARGEPTVHAALAAALWNADTRWADGLAVIDHWFAADEPVRARATAESMITAAISQNHLLAALALRERLAGADHPDVHALHHQLAEQRPEPAAELLAARKAHARAHVEARRDLAPPGRARDLAAADRDLARVLARSDPARADSLLLAALARLADLPGADLEVARTTAERAALARERGAWQEAVLLLEQVREHAERVLQTGSFNLAARTLIAWTCLDLAALHFTHGETARATGHVLHAVERSQNDADHELWLAHTQATIRLAEILATTSVNAAAAALEQLLKTQPIDTPTVLLDRHRRVLATPRQGPTSIDGRRHLAEALALLGALDLQRGRSADARRNLEAAARLFPAAHDAGPELPVYARVAVLLAEVRSAAGHSQSALAVLAPVHTALASTRDPGPQPWDRELVRMRVAAALGGLHLQGGDLDQARAHLDQALEIGAVLRAHDPRATDLATTLVLADLARARVARTDDDLPAALPWLTAALVDATRLHEREPDRRDLRLLRARVHHDLAEHHRQTADPARALAHIADCETEIETLVAAEPHRVDLQRARALARWTRAALTTHDPPKAAWYAEVGRNLAYELARRDPQRLDLAYDRLCWFGLLGADPGESGEHHLRAGCELGGELSVRDPGNADIQRLWWSLHATLGRRHLAARDLDRAIPPLRTAHSIAARLAARIPDNELARAALAESCLDLAAAGAHDRVDLLAAAVTLRRRLLVPATPARQRLLVTALVEFGKATPDRPAARSAWREARILLDRLREPDDEPLLAWLDRRTRDD